MILAFVWEYITTKLVKNRVLYVALKGRILRVRLIDGRGGVRWMSAR